MSFAIFLMAAREVHIPEICSRLPDRFAPRRTQTWVDVAAATGFHPWLHTLFEITIFPPPPPLPYLPSSCLSRVVLDRHSIRPTIVREKAQLSRNISAFGRDERAKQKRKGKKKNEKEKRRGRNRKRESEEKTRI